MVKWGFETEGNEVVDKFSENVTGRRFVITGSSEGGLGAESAYSLARASPAQIVFMGRSWKKTKAVVDKVKSIGSSIDVKFVQLELDSLASVRKAAKEINDDASIPQIDVLMLNAGVMALPSLQLTEDGLEAHFGTNHIGHFLLANLIMPKVLAAARPGSNGEIGGPGTPRIVTVSSYGNIFSGIRFDDLAFGNGKEYNPWLAYGQSKCANILMTISLNEKFRSQGIVAYTLNPGSIRTSLIRHLNDESTKSFLELLVQHGKERYPPKTLQQGCSTQLRAALDPTLPSNEDIFFLHDAQPLLKGEDLKVLAAHSADVGQAHKLWDLSNKIVGEQF
ncbi:NAD(P)-binding protein [Trichoderma pleuroticola]